MNIAGRPWDMYRAEMTDTIRGHRKSRAKLPCVYCSKPTTSVYRVCCDDTDLLDLDPGAPAALEETRAARPPGPSSPRARLTAMCHRTVLTATDCPAMLRSTTRNGSTAPRQHHVPRPLRMRALQMSVNGGYINVRLTLAEVRQIRSAFAAKFSNLPDSLGPDVVDVLLVEKITTHAEHKWKVKFREQFSSREET